MSAIASFITYIVLVLLFNIFRIRFVIGSGKIDSYFGVFIVLVYYLIFHLIFAEKRNTC
jgi:hypothetical protein